MSSFFDNMKKTMGLSKPKQPKSTGHVLGGAPIAAADARPQSAARSASESKGEVAKDEFWEFELEFTAEKMGMNIKEVKVGMPNPDSPEEVVEVSQAMVATITPGSQAASLGVKDGDIIVALNGHMLTAFDDFYNFILALGRPLRIRFMRKKQGSAKPSIGNATSSVKASLSNMFRALASASSTAKEEEALTEEEKAARRETMRKAAADRTLPRDKKVPKKPAPVPECSLLPEHVTTGTTVPEHNHPETLRAMEKTKQLEVQIEQKLGYSPFRPHMSFSGNGPLPAPATTSTATAGAGNVSPVLPSPVNSSQSPVLSADEEELLVSEVDDAFAMLLSLGEMEQDKAKVAVQTVQKMLLNLYSNRTDIKFRSASMHTLMTAFS